MEKNLTDQKCEFQRDWTLSLILIWICNSKCWISTTIHGFTELEWTMIKILINSRMCIQKPTRKLLRMKKSCSSLLESWESERENISKAKANQYDAVIIWVAFDKRLKAVIRKHVEKNSKLVPMIRKTQILRKNNLHCNGGRCTGLCMSFRADWISFCNNNNNSSPDTFNELSLVNTIGFWTRLNLSYKFAIDVNDIVFFFFAVCHQLPYRNQ